MNRLNDNLLKTNFSQLAFTANRFILDHMRRIRIAFGMDLDQAFILGTLAHLNLYHKLHPALSNEEVATIQDETNFKPARLRDLVQVTSLPRETIRRSLLRLEKDQKVRQCQSGWSICPDAITDSMKEETQKTIKNLLNAAEELHGILNK